MKMKPQGKKIYRKKSGKVRWRLFWISFRRITMTLVLLVLVGYLGYRGARMLHNSVNKKNVIPASAPTEDVSMPDGTQAQPQETAPAGTDSSPETQAPPETQESTGLSDVEIVTEPPTQPPTEEPTAPDPDSVDLHGWVLDPDDLADAQALSDALNRMPAGTTYVFVPLKVYGGALYYASSLAGTSSCIRADMELSSIYHTIAAGGYVPAAVINMMEDNLYPLANPDASFHIEGSSERWFDDDPSEGGKPWLSPFASRTQTYLTGIAQEAQEAGFRVIVCSGLSYPHFYSTDLEILDGRCGSGSRYEALAELVEAMQDAAPGTSFYVETPGTAVTDAAAAAGLLELKGIIVPVSASSAGSPGWADSVSTTCPCIPECSGDAPPAGMTQYVLH